MATACGTNTFSSPSPPVSAAPGATSGAASGYVLFDIALPSSPLTALAFAVSLVLAVVVSFAIRFLVASTAFWLLDQSGVKVMSGAFAIFFSGMMLPLVLFPGWLGTLARALPWASYVQVPADVWLGKHTGVDLLAGELVRDVLTSQAARQRSMCSPRRVRVN